MEQDDDLSFGDPITTPVGEPADSLADAPQYITKADFEASQSAMLDNIRQMMQPQAPAPQAAVQPAPAEQLAQYAADKATTQMNQNLRQVHVGNILQRVSAGVSDASRAKLAAFLDQYDGNTLVAIQGAPAQMEALTQMAKGYEYDLGPRTQAPRSGGSGTVSPAGNTTEADEAAREIAAFLKGKILPNGKPIPSDFAKQAGQRMASKVPDRR